MRTQSVSDKSNEDDQTSEKHVQKTPEAAKHGSVITGRTHQGEHRDAIILAQVNDKHPSGLQPAVHENFGITGDLAASDTGKKRKPERAEQHTSIGREELVERAAKGDGFARDLAKQLETSKTPGDRARVQDNADRFYHRGKYAEITTGEPTANERISDSAMDLKALAAQNPALEPVSKLREYADKLPESAERELLTKLSREQAAELSPEMRSRYEQQHAADTHPTLTNTPEGWLHAAQRIAQLPMGRQFEIIGSAFKAGIEQYDHDERERKLGRLIGTIEGAGHVATNLAKIADFAAYCIVGDHGRADKMGQEFGDALGQTIVGGVRLWQAADHYLYNVGFSGDYAKPFRELAELGQNLDDHWRNLSPREQERLKSKFITEMAADGLIAAGGVSAIKRAGSFTEILDTIAMEAINLRSKGTKTASAIRDAVEELVQPHAVTTDGVKIRVPKDPLKDETSMFMSKADDMGESISKTSHRLDKLTGRPQRTDLGKLREPYHWPVMNEHFSADVIRQSHNSSCISAVGQMLTNGKLSEKDLMAKLGTPGDISRLPTVLGDEWTKETIKSTTLAEIGKHGPWAAEMLDSPWTKFPNPPHVVLVKGRSTAGNVLICDPLEGTEYEMTVSNFFATWSGRAAYRRSK